MISNKNLKKYLNKSSEENEKDSSELFVDKIQDIVDYWVAGPNIAKKEYLILYDDIFTLAGKLDINFLPYSGVSSTVYTQEGTDGLEYLYDTMEDFLNEKLELNKNEYNKPVTVLIKTMEHLKLASKQVNNLFLDQELEMSRLLLELAKTKNQVVSMRSEIKKLNDTATQLNTDLENQNKKMVVDFVTILGVFTSITFATFGGIQLLGNVFGKIEKVTAESVGSEIMLGAVFLFGTYLILVSLLTGLSKMINISYRPSFKTVYFMILGFIYTFLIGFFYAHPTWFHVIRLRIKVGSWTMLLLAMCPLIVGVLGYFEFKYRWFRSKDM